jgi:hypothetical protein
MYMSLVGGDGEYSRRARSNRRDSSRRRCRRRGGCDPRRHRGNRRRRQGGVNNAFHACHRLFGPLVSRLLR